MDIETLTLGQQLALGYFYGAGVLIIGLFAYAVKKGLDYESKNESDISSERNYFE